MLIEAETMSAEKKSYVVGNKVVGKKNGGKTGQWKFGIRRVIIIWTYSLCASIEAKILTHVVVIKITLQRSLLRMRFTIERSQ